MDLDATFILIACAAVAAAVVLAVLAGTLTARLFYDATGRQSDDGAGAEREHEVSR